MRRVHFSTVLAAALAVVAAPACSVEVALDGRACPCTDGWSCDESTNTCVRGGVPSAGEAGGAATGAGGSFPAAGAPSAGGVATGGEPVTGGAQTGGEGPAGGVQASGGARNGGEGPGGGTAATGGAQQTGGTPGTGFDLLIPRAASTPSIDGAADGVWSGAEQIPIERFVRGDPVNPNDFSATFSALWDSSNLYVLVRVTDADQVSDSGGELWADDSIEVYVDIGNDKTTDYGDDDFQFLHGLEHGPIETKHNAIAEVQGGVATTATGYAIELAIPWNTLGAVIVPGSIIGFDVAVDDDDDGGDNDTQLIAYGTSTAYRDPSVLGTAKLVSE